MYDPQMAIPQQNVTRWDVGRLPLDENGLLNPATVARELRLPQELSNRPFVVTYGGSRSGNKPANIEGALRYSQLLQENGIGVLYGGMDYRARNHDKFGIMNACSFHNDAILAISPSLFADYGGVRDAGLDNRAYNLVVHDFYPRKILMGVLSHYGIAMPGGFGTLEELVEHLIYGSRHGKKLGLVNIDGFWGATVSLLHTLRDVGLINSQIMRAMTVSPNADIAFEHTRGYLRNLSDKDKANTAVKLDEKDGKRKPANSLHDLLKDDPGFITSHVRKFLSDEGMNVPRVGIVVSGNISLDAKHSRLKYAGLTKEFCEQAEKLGRQTAQTGAVLVLSGERGGLRQVMAEAALKENGAVIWIRRDTTLKEPCEVTSFGREQTFKVPREADKATLFDLISQSTGFLPGGIHTLDRVFEVVTREQTGFGRYNSLLEDTHPTAVKCPVIGYNVGHLWDDAERQVRRFLTDGFVEQKDAHLFQMVPPAENLAQMLIANAKDVVQRHRDVLTALTAKPARPKDEAIRPAAAAPDSQYNP